MQKMIAMGCWYLIYGRTVVSIAGNVITSPKTAKSNRTIKMPKFLCEEMQEYIGMLYEVGENDRIFQITKSYLHHEMDRGAKAAGVKRIRIHDLRHSAISLLIEMGFSALAIAERVGHESIDITYRYAHLFPTKQTEMADKLDMERMGDSALADGGADTNSEFEPERKERENLSAHGNSTAVTEKEDLHYGEKA